MTDNATDTELSPEAAAYLLDLRTLPFEEFKKKYAALQLAWADAERDRRNKARR